MFQRVAEFHQAFGQAIADAPAFPDQSVRDLRVRLLAEELAEFRQAYREGDSVEMADGLADICYIIAGTALAYGLVSPDTKFDSPFPDGLTLPSLTVVDYGKILQHRFDAYLRAETANRLEDVLSTLMQFLDETCDVAMILGLPLNAVFAEVHRSNMSKLMPDGSVLRREDGKIMKSPKWSAPNVAAILGVNSRNS